MRSIAFIAAIVAAAGAASAQDVRIDLGDSLGSTGPNWNNIANGSLSGATNGLVDFNTGLATTIGIDGVGSPWLGFVGDTAGAFPNVSWLVQPATQDGAGLLGNQTGTFRFTGLTASAYIFEVVTARETFNYLNTITINGALANRTQNGTPVVTPWNSTTHGLGDANWLIWDNVVPSGGTVSLVDVAGPNTLGMINAIRITVVPAPAGLAALGILGVLGAARRRR